MSKLRSNNMSVIGVESADSEAAQLATSDNEIKERLAKLKVLSIP